MKIIINTSTLIGSGVTQVAISFLYECLALNINNKYHVFLGNKVGGLIDKTVFDDRFIFYDIPVKPISIFKGGIKSILIMKRLEQQIKADAVFSVFGPSYWTPKAPHLQGYAYSHYVYTESPYFKMIHIKESLKIKLLKKIHLFFLKRNGKSYVSETIDVTSRLEKIIDKKNKQFFTVSNTCNSYFREFKEIQKNIFLPEKEKDEFRFITLCTLQSHKNLDILNKVIPILVKQGFSNVKFVLTIEQNELENNFDKNILNNIIIIGRINPKDCPALYNECDALFLPTLLECFSANYPEAMFMKKAILTSDLSFAKKICENAAIYFDPLDEYDIVKKIKKLIETPELQNEMIINGEKILHKFLTPKERAIAYLEILKDISI